MKSLYMSVKKKLFSAGSKVKGFTLGEMMVVVLILSLATAGLVSTVALASRQFDSSMRQSESMILCSSLKTVIIDELAYTTEIHVGEADENGELPVVSFQSQNYAQEECLGSWTTDNSGSNGYGLIAIGNADDLDEQMLVLGKGAYARGVTAKVVKIVYSNDTHLFTVELSICYQGNEVTNEVFQVRNVNLTHATR